MKDRHEVAKELNCAYSTIERYVSEIGIKPAKVVHQRQYFSKPQVRRMKAHQRAKRPSGKKGVRYKKRTPTCKRANCRYRSGCLMTDKIYQADCQDYEPEYEAGDFCGRVAEDPHDRFVEEA